MSSRRDLAAQQQRLAAEQVQYAKQCQFWTRSLDRNDADSAAVIELNKRMHQLKKLLDPKVLLDIGQGFIKLASDGTDTLINEQQEPIKKFDHYCESVEFLLRRKLRRKLLNRIFRRINRLAAAMDGNLEIPAPPKYGDLRFQCDTNVAKEFYETQMHLDKVHLALAVKRDLDDLIGKSRAGDMEIQVSAEVLSVDKTIEGGEETVSQPTAKDEPSKENPTKDEPETIPSNDTSSSAVPANAEDAPKSNETNSETPAEVVSSKEALSSGLSDPFDFRSSLLKDYKDAFEKAVNKKGITTYTLFSKDDPEEPPEYLGAGIGATARHMNAKEREVEYHRWQTTLLARIPEQPTFEELGLEYRVFNLEERLKEVEKGKGKSVRDEKTQKRSSQEKSPTTADEKEKDKDAMDIDKEDMPSNDPSEKKKPEDEKTDASDSEDGEEKGNEDSDDKSNNGEDAKDDEEEDKAPQQVVRPISLIAVPSFYEQDLRRIKNVHADMIHMSLQNHARSRLEESAAEYNTAFKASYELLKRRNHISEQIRAILYETRRQGIQPDHMQLNAERSHWHARRQQFEHQKLNAMLSSRTNRPVQGTNLTQRYRTLPDRSGIADAVGDCLGDVVDAVEAVARGLIRNEIFNERFVPSSGGEANDSEQAIRLRQMEAARRNELNEVTLRINQLEEVRKKAWKKAMKTKGELDLPHQIVANNGTMQVVHVNMTNYASIPVPILTQGSLLTVPNDIFSNSSIKTYTPKKKASAPSRSTSMTKLPVKAGSLSNK